ncbi:MAG: hypothetical protein J7484_01750 [Microbacterium sp.]|nr:hypothetical protein [Microbacterium sp.]
MTLAHPDARSWAQARSASESPRLGMLEAVACQAHPDVVSTFGADGEAIAALLGRRTGSPARRGLAGVGILLAVIGLLAPIAGVAVLGAESYLIDRVPAETAVPIAAVLFAVAALTVVIAGIAWWRSGAFWSGTICGVGVISAICGVFASISMPTVSGRDGYPLSTAMQIPVWITLALGVLLALVTLTRFRKREPEEQAPAAAVTTVGDRHAAEQAALRIPAAERATILADRDAALRVLAERELLDGDTLERALAAPLGTLFTLDATGRTSA